MEPAVIDWKNIKSVFVEDALYEHINAPKWIDFSAPDQHAVDDETWFCKAECRHPKTAEDFLRSNKFASKVKHLRSFSVFENRDRNLRDGGSTSRRLNKSKTLKTPERLQEDQENENPNSFSTPPEKKKPFEERKPPPKLKSTLSASNLFAGREILNQITEFCSELKKMVMKPKEGENLKKSDGKNEQKEKLLGGVSGENLGNVKEIEKEINKPLVEAQKGKSDAVAVTKQRKLKMAEKENSPVAMDLKVIRKGQEEQRLLQVRTNPPSPQCFSAYREPLRRPKPTTPLKPSKSTRVEKGVLQEMEPNNRMDKEESPTPSAQKLNSQSICVAGKEARSMEMLWILKPCLAK